MNKFINLIMNKITLPHKYHNFADKRSFIGIPNIINIISNIAILIPAIYLFLQDRKKDESKILIFHVILLSLSSMYYHYNPSDKTLFYDILMIATTSMIVLILISDTDHKLLLYIYGIISILYWKYTGDLRLYLLILIGVPIYIIYKYIKNDKLRKYIYIITIINILLRISEHNDNLIYKLSNNKISGHSLKHILGGIGIWYIIILLKKDNKI